LRSNNLDGTYIVLGADGKLGPHWVRAILLNGGKVVALGLEATRDANLQSIANDYEGSLTLYDYDLKSSNPNFLGSQLKSDVSGVVLNAGIDSLPGAGQCNIEDFTAYDWESIFKVNVFGNIEFLNYILKNFKLREASIVFIGSMYSKVSPPLDLYSHFNQGLGATKNPAYAASKAALASVVRQYGTNLASRGIRVNMLSPGGVQGDQDPIFVQKFKEKSPSGKMISPELLGSHLVYLLSSMSSSLIGQNIVVDDGYTVW
jgi:NAD(P)-dependent dehydrogenase (short-subunit alcohol dehydrogenase family)